MLPNESILREAQAWIGTPYRKAGRDRRRGVDCLNFVGLVFLRAGVLSRLPEHRSYSYGFWRQPGDPIAESIEEALGSLAPGVSVDRLPGNSKPVAGDLLCLRQLRRCEKITHTAIVESVASHSVGIIHARQGPGGAVVREQMHPSMVISRIYRITPWGQ